MIDRLSRMHLMSFELEIDANIQHPRTRMFDH